ncbi:DUF2975 domain-containing protein [Micromonospora sp. NPDC050417]|uniref:DUF2975 domain-containing protein n=1 Tax=Micromonospora sp. NPDC050417 TaxID=3364280 RepID=UPI0037B96FC2
MGRLRNLLRSRSYLAELQTILVLALIAGAATVIVNLWAIVTGRPISVEVSRGAEGLAATAGSLRPGVDLDRTADVAVVVEHPSGGQLAWYAAQHLPWYLVALFALAMLLVIVRTARREDPFSDANVGRLRMLGWVVTIGSVLAFGIEVIAKMELSATVITGAMGATMEIPFGWLFGGLCLLALSEVVKRGCAMRADLAGLV